MNVFKLFVGSFHSAAAYRYMRAKANFGMGYALFVVAVATLIAVLYYGLPIYVVSFMPHDGKPPLFDQVMHQIGDQAPIMTLKDGTLATKTAEPALIHVSGDYGKVHFDEPFITIDTSGKATPESAGTPILITDKELIGISKNGPQRQPLTDFTKNGPSTILINHAVADEWVNNFIGYIHDHLIEYYIVFWLICVTCLFVVTFFILLVLGLIGLVISSIIESPLSFGACVGLAALSYTPVALLDVGLLTFFGYAAHTITLLVAGSVTLYAAIKCSEPATTRVTV